MVSTAGYGICNWSVAALHERRRCLLAFGGIIERSCPCSNGRIVFGKFYCTRKTSVFCIFRVFPVSWDVSLWCWVQEGLPLVQQYLFQFDRLMREYLPKLGEHFTQEMINPSMYGSQWFITVFSYSFPFHLALRIWDVFLYEVSRI